MSADFWSDVAQDFGDFWGVGTQRRQQEYNSAEAQINRDFSSAEAEKQRAWEEGLANSAHQREVADLKAAGLNPALSATLGGSYTPQGATAIGSAASTSGAINSAGTMTNAIHAMTGLQALKNQGKMLDNNSAKKVNIVKIIKYIK